jgi:hypothetical protein
MSLFIISIPYPARRWRHRLADAGDKHLSLSQNVYHTEVFDSPAAGVWRILVDWTSIVDWMPNGYIRSLDSEGAGEGAVRHITTGKGVVISERLDTVDERRGRLELSILEPLPWEMMSYHASAQLDETGPGKCRLRWEGCFELPQGGPAADALVNLLKESYIAMFAGIRQQLAVYCGE